MSYNSGLDLILCPSCYQGKIVHQGHEIACMNCHVSFSLLENNIPILLKDKKSWLQNSYAALLEQLDEIDRLILDLQEAITKSDTLRSMTLSKWLKAAKGNQKIYASFLKSFEGLMKTDLQRKISRKDTKNLLDYHDSENIFNYLRRDWSGSETTEKELKFIEDRVFTLIKKHCQNSKNAVVLGAGMGRFAQDVSVYFERTLAVELSFMMAVLYQSLKTKDLIFYDHKTRNSMNTEAQFKQYTASMKLLGSQVVSKNHLDYIVADSQRLPLPSQSVSTVISIYFTDVLPIEDLWREISRVLKPGGVFIHFGPLSYHFSSLVSHYSADDLRKYLENKKVKILDESWDNHSYLKYSETLYSSLYRNWSFAAILP